MILQLLTFAYYMSERITIVVPDGTRARLKKNAYEQAYTQSAYSRKIILEALKQEENKK